MQREGREKKLESALDSSFILSFVENEKSVAYIFYFIQRIAREATMWKGKGIVSCMGVVFFRRSLSTLFQLDKV